MIFSFCFSFSSKISVDDFALCVILKFCITLNYIVLHSHDQHSNKENIFRFDSISDIGMWSKMSMTAENKILQQR